MDYLLDTNALSDIVADNPQFAGRIAALQPNDRIRLCTIVRGEALFGVGKLPAGKRRTEIERKLYAALAGIPCEAVPPAAGDEYAKVKLARQQLGRPLDENDCWIAATALSLSAVLVTRDCDFAGIDGLTVEDWSK